MSDQAIKSDGSPDRLPFNRKERYFTGTVLPMLVACENFKHLGLFLNACNLPLAWEPSEDALARLQFFTEYGFAESVFRPEDHAYWPHRGAGDTPDVVIAGSGWLVAVEAKMYHNPSTADLAAQLWRQEKVIDIWVDRLGLDRSNVAHVLLLPAQLKHKAPKGYHVVEWGDVLNEYADFAPPYWVGVLRQALDLYPDLVPKGGPEFGKYADDKLTGEEIVRAYAAGDLPFDHVGRGERGIAGPRFKKDVETGEWRTVRYEVRTGALPHNPNWFSVSEFLAATGNADLLPEENQQDS